MASNNKRCVINIDSDSETSPNKKNKTSIIVDTKASTPGTTKAPVSGTKVPGTKAPVSNEDFKKYVKVQESGKYNMIVDSDKAAKKAGLSKDTYMDIIRNYETLLHASKVIDCDSAGTPDASKSGKITECPDCEAESWTIETGYDAPEYLDNDDLSIFTVYCSGCFPANNEETVVEDAPEDVKKHFDCCKHSWSVYEIMPDTTIWTCSKCSLNAVQQIQTDDDDEDDKEEEEKEECPICGTELADENENCGACVDTLGFAIDQCKYEAIDVDGKQVKIEKKEYEKNKKLYALVEFSQSNIETKEELNKFVDLITKRVTKQIEEKEEILKEQKQ